MREKLQCFRSGQSTLQPPVNGTTGTQQPATRTHTDIHADTQTARHVLEHTHSNRPVHILEWSLCVPIFTFKLLLLPSSFVSGRLVAVVVGVFRYCLLWLSLFYVTLDVVIRCCFWFVRRLGKKKRRRQIGGRREAAGEK